MYRLKGNLIYITDKLTYVHIHIVEWKYYKHKVPWKIKYIFSNFWDFAIVKSRNSKIFLENKHITFKSYSFSDNKLIREKKYQ